MSRHHMLPPIIYTPQPRPKKIESRKSRIQIRGAGGVKASAETEETSETEFSSPVANKPPLGAFAEIEDSARKPWQGGGRLSDDTLKTMLQVQESK